MMRWRWWEAVLIHSVSFLTRYIIVTLNQIHIISLMKMCGWDVWLDDNQKMNTKFLWNLKGRHIWNTWILRCRCEDNIQMYLREVGSEAVKCGMQPCGSQWGSPSAGNFCINWMTTTYSKITLLHTVSYGSKLYFLQK